MPGPSPALRTRPLPGSRLPVFPSCLGLQMRGTEWPIHSAVIRCFQVPPFSLPLDEQERPGFVLG